MKRKGTLRSSFRFPSSPLPATCSFLCKLDGRGGLQPAKPAMRVIPMTAFSVISDFKAFMQFGT